VFDLGDAGDAHPERRGYVFLRQAELLAGLGQLVPPVLGQQPARPIVLLDKAGRRPIQVLGFAVMAAMFLLIGLIPGVTANAAPSSCCTGSATCSPSSAEHHHVRLPGSRSAPPGTGSPPGLERWASSPGPACSL
jgi:hypothetical protein